MTDNIFMISDASYSSHTKCTGLGVMDLHTGKKYPIQYVTYKALI